MKRHINLNLNLNFIFIFIFIFIVVWAMILIILHVPQAGIENKKMIIHIKKGTSFATISKQLHQHRLIDHPRFFYYLTRIFYNTKKIQAGDHVFEGKLSYSEIIDNLHSSQTNLIKVFIPEGARKNDIFKILKQKPFSNEKKYDELFLKETILKHKDDQKITSLEGFLFPDTYYLSQDFNEKQIILHLINTFKKRLPKAFHQRANDLNLTGYELLILASIIEKETGSDQERALISSVFHNRLKRKMRLQTDPTVIYGIKNFNGNLRRSDLRTHTPYNTYTIPRLPPTPISNPSLKSIQAAMYPAQTKYLYFVAKGDGTSYFSTNLKEHNRAVQRFQKRRRKNYRSTPAAN